MPENPSYLHQRKPDWLKIKLPKGENYLKVKNLLESQGLHTICTSGKCPNLSECWAAGTATFMILGDICTRSCKFCATITGRPLPPDPDEARRIAYTIGQMKLKHVVLTSVDRDDLPDGGASVWADTIHMIREKCAGTTIEALIPDFGGNHDHLKRVTAKKPEILSHNLETVKRLTPLVRSSAQYERSLKVLEMIASEGITSKSGIMAGLGESEDEVMETMEDLRKVDCKIFTIGQYLQPTGDHLPVVEYITPEQFEKYRIAALAMGFTHVESKPLVRSSYHAEKHIHENGNSLTRIV